MRERKSRHRNYTKKKESKITLKFRMNELDIYINYLLTVDCAYLTRRNIINIHNLFNIVDESAFNTDDSKYARYIFIKHLAKLRMDGLSDAHMLFDSLYETKYDDIIDEELHPKLESMTPLDGDGIKHINKQIAEKLKFAFLFKHKDKFLNLFESLDSDTYDNIYDLNGSFKVVAQEFLTEIRNAEQNASSEAHIDLHGEHFDVDVKEIVEELRKPSSRIKFGIQNLNSALNGGAERGRTILLLGLSGGFKSGTLLTLAEHARIFNPDLELKDPTKKPCVIYLTQENSLKETIERYYNLTVHGDDIRNYTPEQVIYQLKTKGKITVEDSNVNIRFIYRKNKAIDTDDCYSIIEEAEDEGYECIMFVHDYIKRIRSIYKHSELRLELASIVDEFNLLAKTKDIPVIIASQLNRTAAQIIQTAIDNDKVGNIDKLGSSHAGESWGMIENTDIAIILLKEYDVTMNKHYLGFNFVKRRGRDDTAAIFTHPFNDDNTMQLTIDANQEESVSIVNFKKSSLDKVKNSTRPSTAKRNRPIVNQEKKDPKDELDDL